MFEDLEVLAARLLATAPAQDDPYAPTLDPDATLIDKLVRNAGLIAAAEAENMAIKAAMCTWARTWQDVQAPESKRQVEPEDLVAAEIGPALHQTPTTAALQVGRAVQIVTRLPLTLAAFRRGDLDLGRVLTIWDATVGLTDADAGKVEQLVLGEAVDQNAAELRKALNKAVITIDPDAAERRRKLTIKARGVYRYQDKDGTSNLRAVLSAIDTGEIYDLIDQTARQTKLENDTRSMDARRADALVFLLTGHDPNLGPQDHDPPPRDDAPPTDQPDGAGPDQPDLGPRHPSRARRRAEPVRPDQRPRRRHDRHPHPAPGTTPTLGHHQPHHPPRRDQRRHR